jgi:hypothetical protein
MFYFIYSNNINIFALQKKRHLFDFDLIWFGLVWFSLVWFGLVWFGLVWFDLI